MRRETMYQLMKKSLAKASRDDDVEEAVKVSYSINTKRIAYALDRHNSISVIFKVNERDGYMFLCSDRVAAVSIFVR